MTTTAARTAPTAVVVGNGKAVHLAIGTRIDEYTIATDTLLCGPGAIDRSWDGHIARSKGTMPILRDVSSYAEPTCKKCIAAASASNG